MADLILKVSDRCDARDCGAQARVRYIFINDAEDKLSSIDFCRHCSLMQPDSLTERAAWVVDETAFI